jgi:uncharacterized membrane protein YqjE
MDQSSPGLNELADASKRIAQRSLDIGANRLELLILEVEEERDRLFRSIIMAAVAGVLGLLAGIAFTIGVAAYFWGNHPARAMAVLTLLYAGGGALLYSKFTGFTKQAQLFSATLDQLRKDRECLAKILQ